jgi:hypothetical protein
MTHVARDSGSLRERMAERTRRAKEKLSERALNGMTIETLGPVVLGERLNASLAPGAHRVIVHDKGAVVFNVLARALGTDRLTEMLRTLVETASDRLIDTDMFLRSLERMSGADLSGFAEQYVFGTGIPRVYYTYEIRQLDDGSWVIDGAAEALSPRDRRFRARRTDRGTWDVDRRFAGTPGPERSLTLNVPFQVVFDESDPGAKRSGHRDTAGVPGAGGTIVIEDGEASFSIPLSARPAGFWLDRSHEVLAWFYSEDRIPKRALFSRGLARDGAEAEALLRRALDAPLGAPERQDGAAWREADIAEATRREDARIWLELAALAFDRAADTEALEALDRAERLLRGLDANRFLDERRALVARAALRSGDYERAWRELEGQLRLVLPMGDSTFDRARRRKWIEGRRGSGEEYALLAMAAFETGHAVIAREALEAAEERQADMSVLREALDSRNPDR